MKKVLPERRKLLKMIEEGLEFLSSLQLESGEFPTKRWRRGVGMDAEPVKNVFATASILLSLRYVGDVFGDRGILRRMLDSAISYIISESEEGFWRFFGKGSSIHFDLDTTSCCLSALRKYDVGFDYYRVAAEILRYKRRNGSFLTWVEDVGAPYRRRMNDIDWCVNANVLLFFSTFGIRLVDTEAFLRSVIRRGLFRTRSLYYESPLCFVYFLTRAYGELRLRLPEYPTLAEYIGRTGWKNPLECALFVSSSVELGLRDSISDALTYLVETRNAQGGWDSYIFFTEGLYSLFQVVYGSEAITTAFVLEALARATM